MKRKKKKAHSRRAKAKPVKKPLSRKPAAKPKRSAAAVIASTVPNPVKGAFLVFNPAGVSYLSNEGESFVIDVTKAKLFPSVDDAKAVIDGALVLADSVSPFQAVEVVPAKAALVPHYVFDLVDGEYLLSVYVRAKGDENALSFNAAKTLVARSLASALKDLKTKEARFVKMWGTWRS